MKAEELYEKISHLIGDYNRDLAYDDYDRVAVAQLILARPEDKVSEAEHKPASVFVSSKDFIAEPGKGEKTTKGSGTVVSFSYSLSSSLECCKDGWMGVVDSQGVFHSCFPIPGFCSPFPGPNRCA